MQPQWRNYYKYIEARPCDGIMIELWLSRGSERFLKPSAQLSVYGW